MRLVVTIYYWVAFVTSASVGVVLLFLLWLVSTPFDSQRRLTHAFVSRWVFQYLRLWPGWRATVRGRELIPPGPCVIIANHQSMADVVAMMGLYRQFKFVSKASLFSLPIVGWTMRMARYVSLHRGKPKSTHAMLTECRRLLRTGMSVVLFPEGTYSTGQLLPFKRGAFILAVEERVPLVPVILKGTAGLIYEDGPWLSPRAHVDIEVTAPVMPDQLGHDPDALSRRVRHRYLP